MSENSDKKKEISIGIGNIQELISDQAKLAFPDTIEETNRRLASKPGSLINFGMGQVAPESIPFNFLRKFFTSLADSSDKELLGISSYGSTKGDIKCIETIKELLRLDNIIVKDKNICLTTGAVQGFSLIIRILANQKDYVFCEAPTYSLNLKTLVEHELNVKGIPLRDDGIDINYLLNKIEGGRDKGVNFKFIYLIPDFQNPTGMVMSLEKRKKIISIARKNHIWIIEDAPYRFVLYEGKETALPSIYSLAPDITIFIGSVSKIFCAGFRVGFLVGPAEIIEKARCIKQGDDFNTPELCQKIVWTYLANKSEFAKHLKKIIEVQKEKRALMLQKMDKFFPKDKGVSWDAPQGGIFIWVELPENINAKNIWEEAIEREGIGIAFGEGFFPIDLRRTNCFRLNFSCPTKRQIQEGIPRLGSIIKEHILLHEKRNDKKTLTKIVNQPVPLNLGYNHHEEV